MKVEIQSSGENLIFKYQEKSPERFLKNFSEILDHAELRARDVKFLEQERKLVIILKRNLYEKVKRFFFGLNVWWANKDPNQESILSIKNIESIDIKGPPKNSEEFITIGGISISKNEIYIGSFCMKENPFEISLKVNNIDITLEDVEKNNAKIKNKSARYR